jgi:hypothetical protein
LSVLYVCFVYLKQKHFFVVKLWCHSNQTDWIPNSYFGFLEDSESTDYLYSIPNQGFQFNSTKPIKLTDKKRSTKHTHKTKDRVTRIPLKTGGELMWSGRESSSCSTSGTRRVTLVTNPVISHEWRKGLKVNMEYISLSWSDIPVRVVAIRISLIEGCC